MQPFVVKLIGLTSGASDCQWHVGREFFDSFGNSEILDADIRVTARLLNHGTTVDVDCRIEGSVTVACDRCLEDLVMPVETSFSESYAEEGTELDLSQDIYDYVLVSLPLQRMHLEGECNSETIRYLSK